MFGEGCFTDTRWMQFGVKHIIKQIPNDGRTGVLAPELLAYLQNINTEVACAEQMRAMATGDYETLRKAPPPNCDITTEPLTQWEFPVNRKSHDIMVTACCLTSVAQRLKPAVVYFHGGGWRFGSRNNVQNPMRLLAQFSGAVVYNVEYRLAPEYMYPFGTDDCWAVLKYVHANAETLQVDPTRITVAGDSAGGSIAAACARRDRNFRMGILKQQVLFYPVLSHIDLDGEKDYHFSSDDYVFDDCQSQWILPSIHALSASVPDKFLYVNNRQEALSPDASPLMDSDFRDLPKTLIICAEYDFLTQQCRTYAKRLAQAGIDTTLMVYRGTNHGFMTRVGRYLQSTDAQKEFANAVKSLL